MEWLLELHFNFDQQKNTPFLVDFMIQRWGGGGAGVPEKLQKYRVS